MIYSMFYTIEDKSTKSVMFPVVPFTAETVEIREQDILIKWVDQKKPDIVKLSEYIVITIQPSSIESLDEFHTVFAGEY